MCHVGGTDCNPDYATWTDGFSSCQEYFDNGWCTSRGQKGPAWAANGVDHLSFYSWKSSGFTGLNCPQCGCGGGKLFQIKICYIFCDYSITLDHTRSIFIFCNNTFFKLCLFFWSILIFSRLIIHSVMFKNKSIIISMRKSDDTQIMR